MWKNPLIELPANEQIVWIRVGTNYGDPVLAQFNSSSQEFTSEESGLDVHASLVARWKAQ